MQKVLGHYTFAGAWIETDVVGYTSEGVKSRPSRARGLKLAVAAEGSIQGSSRPSRARELKLDELDVRGSGDEGFAPGAAKLH